MAKKNRATYAERIAEAPALFMGKPVPAEVAARWKTWDGVTYRRYAVYATNTYNVPDQRFGVLPPPGMCAECLEDRRKWRDMYFDPRKGYRWPGTPVLEWSVITTGDWVTERRVEWDEKCIEMMQQAERFCLEARPCTDAGRLHLPRTCLVHAVLPAYCPCAESAETAA